MKYMFRVLLLALAALALIDRASAQGTVRFDTATVGTYTPVYDAPEFGGELPGASRS